MSVCAARAQAQQIVLDVTYTATTDNTSDSHYFAMSPATFPANWVAPVDYAHGTAYVRVDVQAKPSAKKTLFNVCPEGNAGGANCLPLSPAYTAPGVINFSGDMPSSWNFSSVDWTKGVKRIAFILKDENQAKVQGNADFYPTTIHATVTFVAKGGTYVPPSVSVDAGEPPLDAATPAKDAGVPASDDAGMAHAEDDGGTPDAAPSEPPPTLDASLRPAGSGAATLPAAGSIAMMTANPAGRPASAGTAGTSQPPAAVSDVKGGCSIAGASSSAALGSSWLAAGLVLLARRRRRTQRGLASR
jgi:hypothetical protein